METKRQISVVLSSASRRVQFLKCFRTSANKIGCYMEIIAIGAGPEWNPRCQIADAACRVLKATAPGNNLVGYQDDSDYDHTGIAV